MGEIVPLPLPREQRDRSEGECAPTGSDPRPLRRTGDQERTGRAHEVRAPQRTEEEPLWRELVGDQLRRRRHEREERLVDVAERAGVSPQYLSEVERGLKDPSSEMLAAVAGSLDLTVRELTVRAARGVPSASALCLAA